MSLWPIITASHRGRLGRYDITINIDAVEDPQVEPEHVDLERGFTIRWGEMDETFGPTIIPSWTDLTILDPWNKVYERFSQPYEETDYMVVISGPGLLWRGRIVKARYRKPLAPRTRRNVISLRVACGLALTQDMAGATTVGASMLSTFYRAIEKVNRYAKVYYEIDTAPVQTPHLDLLYAWRWKTELSGQGADEEDASKGDFGRAFDQIERAAQIHGARVFQHVDGNIYVRHTPMIGQPSSRGVRVEWLDAATLTWGPHSFDVDELDITLSDHGGVDADQRGGVRRVGTIVLKGAIDNFVVDPGFTDVGVPGQGRMWSGIGTLHFSGEGAEGYRAIAMAADAMVEQSVMHARPYPGARLRFRVRLAFDPGTPTFSRSRVRIRLVTEDETYYLNSDGDWVTSEATVSLEWPIPPTTNDDFVEWGIDASSSFPGVGTLELRLMGVNSPTHRIWYSAASIALVDTDGEPVDDWTAVYNGASGDLVEILSVPRTQIQTGESTYEDVAYIESERYSQAFHHLHEWQMHDRRSQQREDLDLIETTVTQLVGPGTRLAYDGREYIPNGLVVDPDEGLTKGIWREVLPAEEVEA